MIPENEFQELLRVYVRLLKLAYGIDFEVKIGELKMNYIVKDDNPDVGFKITGGEQKDAEGNIIPTTFEVVSSDEKVLAVSLEDGNKSGTVTFGSPGMASFEVTEKNEAGEIIASGGDSFTVTTGDPASIEPISVTFDGLTPVDV